MPLEVSFLADNSAAVPRRPNQRGTDKRNRNAGLRKAGSRRQRRLHPARDVLSSRRQKAARAAAGRHGEKMRFGSFHKKPRPPSTPAQPPPKPEPAPPSSERDLSKCIIYMSVFFRALPNFFGRCFSPGRRSSWRRLATNLLESCGKGKA